MRGALAAAAALAASPARGDFCAKVPSGAPSPDT
eukprot:gene4562-1246_t